MQEMSIKVRIVFYSTRGKYGSYETSVIFENTMEKPVT